jgi:hypothetical protein
LGEEACMDSHDVDFDRLTTLHDSLGAEESREYLEAHSTDEDHLADPVGSFVLLGLVFLRCPIRRHLRIKKEFNRHHLLVDTGS